MHDDERPTPLWAPSTHLYRLLRTAMWATLATGLLCVVGPVVTLTQGKVPGFTGAHAAGWAALLPGFLIARAYMRIGAETQRPSLEKSSLCVFVAIALAELYELAALDLFPFAGQVVLWIAFSIGLVGLIALPFTYEPEGHTPSPEPAETAAPADETTTRNWLGGLGVLAIVGIAAAKFLGKGILFKVVAARGIGRMMEVIGIGWMEAALLFLGLLLLIYLVWFAIAKIQTRSQLGLFALWLGGADLLGMLLFLGAAIACGVTLAIAAEEPGVGPDELARLEAEMETGINVLAGGAGICWALLTLGFFALVRNRYAPALLHGEPQPLGEGG